MPPDFPALAALLFAASPHPVDHPSLNAGPPPVTVNIALVRRLAEAEGFAISGFIQINATGGGVETGFGAPFPATQTVPIAPTDPVEPQPAEPADARPAEDPAAPDNPVDGYIIVVEGMTEAPPGDPLFQFNADTYEAVQEIDQAIVEPIANIYEDGLPRPVRKGLSNFFGNLREPIVFLNFLLQGKVGKAAETVGRFAINSTLGVAGLVDVAKTKPFNLPYRSNGFANTLGFYGVDTGAFLYVPLIGPTTVRDLIGSGLDTLVMPTAFGDPFNRLEYGAVSYTIRALDERIELEGKHDRITDSDFPYATMRETYLCERQRTIDALRNRPLSECGPEALTSETPVPEGLMPDTAAPESMMPETAAPEGLMPDTAAPESMMPETVTDEPGDTTIPAE